MDNVSTARKIIGEGKDEMLDRYLFKAKRTDNGEWAQGSLFERGLSTYIALSVLINPIIRSETNVIVVEVNKNTICRCTGLKDKNGNLIWENDILYNGNYFVVKWNVPCARFDIVLNNSHNIPMGKWESMICDWKTNDFKEYRKSVDYEVIGNRFDSPELLLN